MDTQKIPSDVELTSSLLTPGRHKHGRLWSSSEAGYSGLHSSEKVLTISIATPRGILSRRFEVLLIICSLSSSYLMQFEVKPKSSMFADILACWPTHTLIAVTLGYTPSSLKDIWIQWILNIFLFKLWKVVTVHLYLLEIFELIEFLVYIVKAPREWRSWIGLNSTI